MFDTKKILIAVLVLQIGAQLMFCHISNFHVLMVSRILAGFFQVFISIYFPVWADTFGTSDRVKTMWLTALLVCSPIGVLVGYILCASLLSYGVNWRWAIYI